MRRVNIYLRWWETAKYCFPGVAHRSYGEEVNVPDWLAKLAVWVHVDYFYRDHCWKHPREVDIWTAWARFCKKIQQIERAQLITLTYLCSDFETFLEAVSSINRAENKQG